MAYAVEVVRKWDTPKSAGVLYLYKDDELISQWPCITGSVTPKHFSVYGGCTPPIFWNMVTQIGKNRHPQGHTVRGGMAFLYPAYEEEKAAYPNRTYDLDKGWPFMIHVRGRSSGCIAVFAKHWTDCTNHLNKAWEDNGGSLLIHVMEEADLENTPETVF